MNTKISKTHISYAFVGILMLLTLTIFVSCTSDTGSQSERAVDAQSVTDESSQLEKDISEQHGLDMRSERAIIGRGNWPFEIVKLLDLNSDTNKTASHYQTRLLSPHYFDNSYDPKKNATFKLDLLEEELGVYSATLALGFYLGDVELYNDKDPIGKSENKRWVSYPASADTKLRGYYNKWFGDGEFNSYFESPRGVIFLYMKLDKVSSGPHAGQHHYSNIASGAIYFKPWELSEERLNKVAKQQGPTFTWEPIQLSDWQFISGKPTHCLNLTKGQHQCFLGEKVSEPGLGSGYVKLGEFKNFNVSGVDVKKLDFDKR